MSTAVECLTCKPTGLALMPVRYSVVPKDLARMPSGIRGKGITSVTVTECDYSLRTLREGFLYLFFDKGAGSYMDSSVKKNYWEVYSVNRNGDIFKQPSEYLVKPAPELNCSRNGHRDERLQYICIPTPDLCANVFFAFSEHQWSDEAVKRYTDDKGLRETRMQKFDVQAWLGKKAVEHATSATSENIGSILEYRANLPKNHSYVSIRHADVAKYNDPYSPQELGKHDDDGLKQVCSEFPFHSRLTYSRNGVPQNVDTVLADMQISSRKDQTSTYPPALFALWDTIGIARELNGFRNTAAAMAAQYQTEQGDWLHTYRSLISLEQTLTEAGEEYSQTKAREQWKRTGHRISDEEIARQKTEALRLKEPERKQKLALLNDYEMLSRQDMLDEMRYMDFTMTHRMQNAEAREHRLKEIREQATQDAKRRQDYLNTEAAQAKQKARKAWVACQEKLGEGFSHYRKNIYAFHSAWRQLLDARTLDLVMWLEAPSLLTTLNDYHDKCIADGVFFNDMIGDVIFGIQSSPGGAKLLEHWIMKVAPTDPSNLLWRAIYLNQKEAREETDQIVTYGRQHIEEILTSTTIKNHDAILKTGQKLWDLYKKADKFIDEASKVGDKGQARLTKYTMLGLDKVIKTSGDTLFKALGGKSNLAHSVGGCLAKHLLLLRSGVSPESSAKLLRVQASYQAQCNTDIIKFWEKTASPSKGDPITPAERQIAIDRLNKTEHHKAVQTAWDEAKESAAGSKRSNKTSALMDARFNSVLMLWEAFNMARLTWLCQQGDKKADWKAGAAMATSALTLVGLACDLRATGTKALQGMLSDHLMEGLARDENLILKENRGPKRFLKDLGAKSEEYQKLKLTGGMLSAASSMVGMVMDAADFYKKKQLGENTVAYLYAVKFLLGGANAFTTWKVTYTYITPRLSQMAERLVVEQGLARGAAMATAEKVVTEKAAQAIILRVLGIGLGGWITIGVIGIQIAIYFMEDSELEKWANHCRFGKMPHQPQKSSPFYEKLKDEDEALGKALFAAIT